MMWPRSDYVDVNLTNEFEWSVNCLLQIWIGWKPERNYLRTVKADVFYLPSATPPTPSKYTTQQLVMTDLQLFEMDLLAGLLRFCKQLKNVPVKTFHSLDKRSSICSGFIGEIVYFVVVRRNAPSFEMVCLFVHFVRLFINAIWCYEQNELFSFFRFMRIALFEFIILLR